MVKYEICKKHRESLSDRREKGSEFMKDMNGYYDFSGQKFGYPLSLSINGFSQNVFTRQSSLELSYVLCGEYEAVTEQFSTIVHKEELILIAPYEMHLLRKRCGKDDGKIQIGRAHV